MVHPSTTRILILHLITSVANGPSILSWGDKFCSRRLYSHMVVLEYKGDRDMGGGGPRNGSPDVKAPSGNAARLLLHLDPAILLHQPVLPDPNGTFQNCTASQAVYIFLPARTYITSCHQELGPKATFSHMIFPHQTGQ